MRRLLFLLFVITPTIAVLAQNVNSDSTTTDRTPKSPYDSFMLMADSSIAKQDFNQAKDFYEKALQIKPKDPFALEMIREMNNTIRIQATAQLRDNELKRRAEITNTLDNALKAILDKKYDTARALYIRVLTLKPVKSQEEFAIQKINSLDQVLGNTSTSFVNNLATTSTSQKQTTGREKVPVANSGVPATARVDASTTNSAKNATPTLESKLAEPKRKSKLDLLIDSAQKAVTELNYEKAYSLYTQFLNSNPSKAQRAAALSKIQAINVEMRKSQEESLQKDAVTTFQGRNTSNQKNDSSALATNKKNKGNEVEKQPSAQDAGTTTEFNGVVTKAITAINEENWPVALNLYNYALTLNPTKLQENAIRKEIDVINTKMTTASKKSLKNGSGVKTTLSASTRGDTTANKAGTSAAVKPVSSLAKQSNTLLSQNASNGTNRSVSGSSPARNRYSESSDINKSAAYNPGGNQTMQVFDTTDQANIEQIKEFSKKFISQPSGLNISDSSNDIKLTCQGVAFNGKNAFIKFLIRNESSDPYSLGSFQMLYVKNYGILKKLAPRYISETPTILPNKVYPLVYVVEAPRSVQPDEVFVFEMEDRPKQTKLIVNVSGAAFLQKGTLEPSRITIDEADKYLGETVTICDNVSGGRFLETSATKPTLLNMGGVFPNHKLTILINFVDRKNFKTPPETTYSGKNVCVTGKLIDFKGKPEIIVESPEELKIDEAKQGLSSASKVP